MPRRPIPIDKKILDKLSEAIKYSGFSNAYIAKKVGINANTLSDYKYYRAMPSIITFKKICIVIDADANEILGLK